ncbi:MAG: sterol desaturase family protein [Spirochaetaceae bacterium]|nr:MAG: sterol desaturase family protein [Spirochaetaceae bacterium]
MVWTAYESITLWAFANRIIPYVDWRERPVYCALLLVAVLFMREAHFYLTHRLSHWKPLYKAAHYLHHKNVNVGPWSGMSMHPIEHMLYLSGIFLHWIIPSHPLHAMAHIIVSGLAPAKGHAGFYKFVVDGRSDSEHEKAIRAGGYFHYLHHKYFTVNFGTEAVPMDKWFGSFHDGSPDAHVAMLERRKRKRNVM